MPDSNNIASEIRPPAIPPAVVKLAWCDPLQAARRLAHLPHMILLESSMIHAELGRYSFLMADPVEWFSADADAAGSTFEWLNSRSRYPSVRLPDLPDFQGGVAGLLGYEFNSVIERVPVPETGLDTPPVALGVYDVVIAWDHHAETCWLVSQGFPEVVPDKRVQTANCEASATSGTS